MNSFEITNVSLFDGEKLVNNTHVVIKDGWIIQVINLDLDKKENSENLVIDGTGKFLMPSMIDSEGHFMLTSETYLHLLNVTQALLGNSEENEGKILRPSFIDLYKKFSEENLLKAINPHGLYGWGDRKNDVTQTPSESGSFEKYMRFGVTTVLDMAAYPWPANYFKRSREQWKTNDKTNKEANDLKKEFLLYADLFTSGMWAIPANVQFGYFGVDPVYNLKPEGPWDEEDIIKWVDRRESEGSDHIKVFFHTMNPDFPRDQKISTITLNALVKAAHKKNLLVYTHNQIVDDAFDVMESNSDVLIHTPGSAGAKDKMFTDEFAQKLVHKIKYIVPTLGVLLQNCESPYALANRFSHALGEENPGENFTESYVESSDVLPYIYATDEMRLLSCGSRGNKAEDEITLAKVAKVYDFGAYLLAGTDPDTTSSAIEGLGIHYELYLIREALKRYSSRVKNENLNLEVLKTATSNPALAYGLHIENGHKPKFEPRGFIKKGYRADFILLKESPMKNILNTLKIEKIWKAGFLFDRQMVRPECESGDGPSRKIIREMMGLNQKA